MNNATRTLLPKSLGISFEEMELLRGPAIQADCKMRINAMLEKYPGGAVHSSTNISNASNMCTTKLAKCNYTIDSIAISTKENSDLSNLNRVKTEKTSSHRNNTDSDSDEHVRNWEREAMLHFRNSSWEDVICACNKVLKVTGQTTANFDVLFQIGYAQMRVGDYEKAYTHFLTAYRIDNKKPPLKLAICELRRKMKSGPLLKRSREEVLSEQSRPSKRTCTR